MSAARLLPEWSSLRCVVLVWPYPEGDWQANYAQVEQCYWSILENLARLTDVWLLVSEVKATSAAFNQEMARRSIPQERVHLLTDIAYNDTWVRDFGPLSTTRGYLSFTFNGWGQKYDAELDNAVASAMKERLGNLEKLAFVCEGGALETNGEVLLLSRECVVDSKRNPQVGATEVTEYLIATLGIGDIEWIQGVQLTGDDTDGHIDTIARFAGIDRLVITGRNPNHPDANALQALFDQADALAAKRQWQLWELPTPVVCSEIDGRILPATYANFLIVEKTVLVPVYGCAEDAEALAVLSQAFHDRAVTPVPCAALLEQHGSLHCATMQIAEIAS